MQSFTLYMERPGKIIIPGRFVCKLPDKREFVGFIIYNSKVETPDSIAFFTFNNASIVN